MHLSLPEKLSGYTPTGVIQETSTPVIIQTIGNAKPLLTQSHCVRLVQTSKLKLAAALVLDHVRLCMILPPQLLESLKLMLVDPMGTQLTTN